MIQSTEMSGKKHSLFDMIDRAEERIAKLEAALQETRAEAVNLREVNAELREVNAELREDEKRLVLDRDFVQAQLHRLQIRADGVRDQRDEAYAEVAQLKDALKHIRDFKFGWRGINSHEDVSKLQQIAQKTLELNTK